MKQLKLIFFSFICGLLNSCCSNVADENDSPITSRYGLNITFKSSYYVLKADLIGDVRKTNSDMVSRIHLNAGDTITRFLVFYSSYEHRDSIWVDSISISYTPRPRLVKNDLCGDEYDEEVLIVYDDAHVSSTTFAKAEISQSPYHYPMVYITR